ncbi:phasin family protein [Bradyrhizobium sp.]|uniref:phasin family protein n=1 Tax=Bradyrhizobium sp. TaxID=376 RepID=UPI00239D13E7|nr:phasin family protein [Bradyrhizobium sp.]MDE2377636.1 phasin family protein [Bradyrhizobium sp.]
MLSVDENKPAGKSGRRKNKKKAEQQAKAIAQQASRTAPLPDAESSGEINLPVVAAEVPAVEPAPRLPQRAAEPVGLQTIANAYGSFAKNAIERSWTFLGQLATARSPVEAFAIQMAFAKEAAETFAAGTRMIGELHGELARQRVLHLEDIVARITRAASEPRAVRH